MSEERTLDQKLANEIVQLRERLHRAGLHKTAAAMNLAEQEVGWEFAKKIEARLEAGE